jgi:RNA polymerase sigma-70 factor (ECF subfamily)
VTDGGVLAVKEALETSTTLLIRVRQMEPTAWERFVRLYGPLIYRWRRQAGLQEADAADTGQEVFRAVFRAIGDFRHDRGWGSLRGWLRVVTANKLRDFRRRQRPEGGGVELNELAAPAEPDEAADPDEALLLLRQAVELVLPAFKDETRTAFLRVVVDRCDPAAVARELGISVNAVYLAKSRVCRRLREEFAGLVEV